MDSKTSLVTTEEFDTVMYGTGRTADTRELGLETAGVKISNNGKIPVEHNEATNVPHIFAIGKCLVKYIYSIFTTRTVYYESIHILVLL